MYRIIEELSAIVNKLLEIVKEQSKLLEMADIPQDTVQKLSDKKKDIDKELDLVEYRIRRL